MPIFRTRSGACWTIRSAAQIVAVLLWALMPLAPSGDMWPTAEFAASAAGPDHASPARHAKHADRRANGLTKAAEVGARPSDAKAPGLPPSPPAVASRTVSDFMEANRSAATIAADQEPAGALPPPFHGRAPPRT